jgi:hypothetical protein
MTRDLTPATADADVDDEIVAEVRAIRRQLAASVDFDLDRIFEQVKAVELEERARGRTFVPPFAPNAGATA